MLLAELSENTYLDICYNAFILIENSPLPYLLKMMNDGIEKYLEDNIKVIALN